MDKWHLKLKNNDNEDGADGDGQERRLGVHHDRGIKGMRQKALRELLTGKRAYPSVVCSGWAFDYKYYISIFILQLSNASLFSESLPANVYL